MGETERAITRLIDQFVRDVTECARRAALDVASRALTTAHNGRQRANGKRTQAQLEAARSELLEYVRRNPGQTVTQIAAALGCGTAELALPLSQLVKARRVRTKGQKRGTRYSLR